MENIFHFFKEKKNLINLLGLLVLVVALPIGINLVRQQQILRSRAAVLPIEVTEGDCVEERNGKKVLVCSDVPLKLISPIGGPKSGRVSSPTSKPAATSIPRACSSTTKTKDGKPVVNVKKFNNDIQAAIDCFKDLSGGAVYIPAGTYTTAKKISIYSNVTIFGDGMDRTIITTSSTTEGVLSNDSSKGQANITIRGLTLKGPGNIGGNCCYGLKLENLSHGFVIDVASDNWGLDGIYLGYKRIAGVLKGADNIRISGCRASNNDRNGISLTHGMSNVIDNCRIENNNADPAKRASAIDLEPDSGAEVSNNLILNNQLLRNKGNGIGLGPNPNEPPPAGKLSNNVVCSNNTRDNDFAGIVDYPGTIYFGNTGNDPRPKDNGSTSACDVPSNLNYLQEGPPKPLTKVNTPSLIQQVFAQDPGCEEGVDCGSDEGDDPTGAERGGGECTSDNGERGCGAGMYCDKHNSPDGTGVCLPEGRVSGGGRSSGDSGNGGGGGKKKTKNTNSPTPQATNTPSQTQTPIPTLSSTPVPTSPPIYTLSFKIAESQAGLSEAESLGYSEEPLFFNYQLEDEKVGLKQIWVEFLNSQGQKVRKFINIKLSEEDPQIDEISCRLDISSENIVFDIKGERFGKLDGARISSDNQALQILEWSEDLALALLERPSLSTGSQTFRIKLKRGDGQETEDIPCLVGVTLISLGTETFCREKGKQETEGVQVIFVSEDGNKTSEVTSIDKGGVMSNFKTKLEIGKKYLISVKAPGGLRRNATFTGSSGTSVIKGSEGEFIIPIGDIFPNGGDGVINSADRVELSKQWVEVGKELSGDFNKDLRVNSIDWACMRHGFGEVDEPLPNLIP